MVLEGPGRFELEMRGDLGGEEFASASSPDPAIVTVTQRGLTVDKVFLGAGSTHSWWNSNPLIGRPISKGDVFVVEITGPAALRLDWPVGLRAVGQE